ncbi:MAG: response regulator transcription factor [Bacteroidales bacterium]|jgi:NarL family two-component system response regulator LiaR|nr:response regulator transcription factor [Bacteroidales bacterium]
MKKISVYIVDDHTLFREGLTFLLSQSDFIDSVTDFENGSDFLKHIQTHKPDVVLMDIEMPEIDGITVTRKALAMHPDILIIALSMYGYEQYYTEMIDAGAHGFLMKNSQFHAVQEAIQEVYKGNDYFSPEILDSIIKNLYKKKEHKTTLELTEREIEILYNICKGYSNAEIGETLSISKRTVDKHRENLLLKTASKNTAGLVVYAIKNGVFEI